MYRFLETINVKDGEFLNLKYHQDRVEKVFRRFYAKIPPLVLADVLTLPTSTHSVNYKCRVIYSKSIELVEFTEYIPKPVRSLKIVNDDSIDYSFKFADRRSLEVLLSKKGNCDDVLIIKNGLVTDTSYSNILFYDGRHWLTPDTPLLKGTCRQRLLDNHTIREQRVSFSDLTGFSHFMLINAMLGFDENKAVEISGIDALLT